MLAVLPYAYTRIIRVYALSSSVAGRIQFIIILMGKGGGVSGSDGVLCPRVCLVFWVVSVCVCEYVSMCCDLVRGWS